MKKNTRKKLTKYLMITLTVIMIGGLLLPVLSQFI